MHSLTTACKESKQLSAILPINFTAAIIILLVPGTDLKAAAAPNAQWNMACSDQNNIIRKRLVFFPSYSSMREYSKSEDVLVIKTGKILIPNPNHKLTKIISRHNKNLSFFCRLCDEQEETRLHSTLPICPYCLGRSITHRPKEASYCPANTIATVTSTTVALRENEK